QIATQSASFPVNVSAGGAIGVESADNFSLLSVGPQALASRTLDNAGQWVAYGGASILFTRFDLGNNVTETDVSFQQRGGMEFRPNTDLRLLAEAQLAVSDEVRDDFSVTFGVLFPF